MQWCLLQNSTWSKKLQSNCKWVAEVTATWKSIQKKKKKKINPLLKQNSFEFQYISENKWSYLENLCLQIMQQDQATVKI